MNIDLKKIASGFILMIRIILFFISIANNNFNFSLISLTSMLIFWVLYSLILNIFDVKIFAYITSISGFLVFFSVLFMFGIEEVPFPMGAVVFHSSGIAASLAIGFFSLFPIIILYQMSPEKSPQHHKEESLLAEETPDSDSELENNDWEIATEDDLYSGEFEIG